MRSVKLLAQQAGRLTPKFAGIGPFIVLGFVAVTLCVGCHKSAGQSSAEGGASSAELDGIVSTDPDVLSNLENLTGELRNYMHQHPTPKSFDEFIAGDGITPPAPPAGEKYKINPRWRVILVSANSK